MTDKEQFEQIQDKFTKLGWMPRENLLWMLATLAELLKE